MSLDLILGPMTSGKSTETIRRIKRLTAIGKKVIVIKHSKDNRYVDECMERTIENNGTVRDMMVTHDQVKYEAIASGVLNIPGFDPKDYDHIFIEEAQWFSDLFDQVYKMVNEMQVNVTVVALDGTFDRKQFGSDVSRLIAEADSYEKLYALCEFCSKESKEVNAPFSKRMIEDSDRDVVGGRDLYRAACRKHHNMNISELKTILAL